MLEYISYLGTKNTELGTDFEFLFGNVTFWASFLEFNADAMDLKPFIYKYIVLKVPNAADGVYNIHEFTFLKGVSSGEIRTIGRTIGDDLGGPLFYVGYGLGADAFVGNVWEWIFYGK